MFKAFEKGFSKSVDTFNAILLVVLTLTVFAQVIMRYVFKTNVAGLEEVPRYTMIFMVYLGSITLTKRDNHVRIDILDLIIKNRSIKLVCMILMDVCAVIATAFFGYLCYDYVAFLFEAGDKSAGMGLPLWSVVGIMVVSCVFMIMYFIINIVKRVKELRG